MNQSLYSLGWPGTWCLQTQSLCFSLPVFFPGRSTELATWFLTSFWSLQGKIANWLGEDHYGHQAKNCRQRWEGWEPPRSTAVLWFYLCCRVGLVSVKCTVKHTITGQWLTACACHVSIIVLPCVWFNLTFLSFDPRSNNTNYYCIPDFWHLIVSLLTRIILSPW